MIFTNNKEIWVDEFIVKIISGASLIAQLVKNQPAMQETPVQFLGQEDPLEESGTTHSRILAWISTHLLSFPASGSFQMSQHFA